MYGSFMSPIVIMKLYAWFVCCILIIHSVCGSCDRHGRCDRSVSYDSNEELTETPTVDQKINVNKTEIDTDNEEIYDVLQISNTIEDKDARNLFLQKEILKLRKENLKLKIEIEQFKLKSIQKRNAFDATSARFQNLNNSRSNTDELFLLLDKYESSLEICNENYRCAKNEIFQLELDKTDAELKFNRCSNMLVNTQNAFNGEISAVIALQTSVTQLNTTVIQAQSQLNLCKSSKVASNDTVHCHVQFESLGLEFLDYKENFRKLHRKVSETENELQNCEQKLSEQNKKLELKIKDAEELSGSLMECQRKSGIVVNQTQMIQNEVRENVNNLEQAINAALEGKLINLESRLQNKLSAVTNDVSTLTNKLDAQKNSNDEQNRLLTSQLEALSQETQFLNTSIISTGDAKKKRGLERLRQTGGLVDLGGELFYLRIEPKQPWAHAYSLCQELGMRMVILDSEAKNNKILNYIKLKFGNNNFWIGLLRVTKPTGGYSWIWQGTHEAVRYNAWDTNEPSNHAGEECVEIWNARNKPAWNNKNCNHTNGVVCEMIP